MKSILISLLAAALPVLAQPTITSDSVPPVVRQGTTHQFTANCSGGCTYSLVAGSVGTIDSGGLYQAPAKVTVNQSIFGCQVLPPDSAYNAPIDKLPVRTESAAWVQLLKNGGRAINMVPHDVPINVISSSTPSHPFTFTYNPSNNGKYQVPDLPDLDLQSGYYFSSADRHYLAVRPDTCAVTEVYNWAANLPTFNIWPVSSSGFTYNTMTGALPADLGTNAAGAYMIPNILRAHEVMKALATGATVIPHPINVTLANYSQLGGAAPEWPATSVAIVSTGTIPYGARFRLKASYNYAGSNPVTAILVNTMKQYGFFVSDGGLSMDTYGLDADAMPPQMGSALAEIKDLFPASALTNFEFVKQSDLAPTVKTGPEGGLIDPAKAAGISGYVPPQYAQVVVTDGSGKAAKMRVLLQGATVDFERSLYTFQAGSRPLALPYHISGVSDSSVICSMSPSLGTLDVPTCTYTPPRTLTSPTITTVTVTSNSDPGVRTQTRVLVLPDGDLGLLPAAPNDYTDTHGQRWWAVSPLSNFPVVSNNTLPGQGTYQDAPPTIEDWFLYGYGYHPRSDIGIDIQVPPGNYKITVKALSSSAHYWMFLESQGQGVYPWLDTYTLAGGVASQPVDLVMPATVAGDGRLRIYSRRMPVYGNPPAWGDDTIAKLAAVLIQADTSGQAHITVNPAEASVKITPGQTQQFTCIGWYMANTCTWAVTSGPGSISANGLYTAPSAPYDPDIPVTITATSTVDQSKTATATLNLTFGTIALTPAASSIDRQMSVTYAASINGMPYSRVTWSMSPSIGTLNRDTGAYLAPNALDKDTTITITATSTDNAAHSASTTLMVRANPLPIYIGPGLDYPNRVTDNSGIQWTLGSEYFSCTGGQCYPGPNADHSQPLPTASTAYPPVEEVSAATKLIWDGAQTGSGYAPPPQTDFTYTFPLPNGTYQVAVGFNRPVPSFAGISIAPSDYAKAIQNVSINGVPWLTGWSTFANCGVNVACSPPPTTVTVTNKQIQVLFHGANLAYWPAGSSNTFYRPEVNLIRILPVVTRPTPPVCDAGPRQSFRAGYAAQLDGSRSSSPGGSGLTYQWQQLSGASRVRWSSREVAAPTITGLAFGSYVFQLTVTDSSNQSTVCSVAHGAVATDANGVVITNNPALDALLGPVVRLSANPWQWFDDRNKVDADLQITGMDTQYPAWWDAPGAGTVTVAAGSTSVTGSGTAFSTTFCQGPASPKAPKSNAVIAIWYKTGSPGDTGRRMSAVTGCTDDTHMTVDTAWDSGTIPAGSGLSYAADDDSTHYASNWGWGQAASPGNYYDNVAGYYALYYRSGIDVYLAAAQKLADRVWRSPMVDRGNSAILGHGGGYGYAGRTLSALGLVLRARELEGTAKDMWPGLHQIWDTYMASLSGVDKTRGPGMWDTAEEAHHLAMVSYCAMFDTDAVYRSRCKSAIADSLASVWTPYMSPGGSWRQLYYDLSSWDTGTSATLTNGSTSVLGNGTSWTAGSFPGTVWFTNQPAVRPGDNSAGDVTAYTVTFVDSTHLALGQPYQGASGTHGWAVARGTTMVGWGVQPGQMGLLAAAFDLAAKAIADTDPANSTVAHTYSVAAANWIRTSGYWSLEKGMYAAVGGVNCAGTIADSNVACTGGNSAGQARALNADALRGIMSAYAYDGGSALRDFADTLYNAMFAKSGTCSTSDCVPDGEYVRGLDDDGTLMTATPPSGNRWFGGFFGFGNLSAWPAYRVGGLQPSKPQKGYVGINLAQIRGATKARVTVIAPSGSTTEVECAASPCAVTVDGRQGKHLVQLQYLSTNGAVLASTVLPM